MGNTKNEEVLGDIQNLMLEAMLSDLRDHEKCTPQLYNAIIKELGRNGIDCLPKAGETTQNALNALLETTKDNFEDMGYEVTVRNMGNA